MWGVRSLLMMGLSGKREEMLIFFVKKMQKKIVKSKSEEENGDLKFSVGKKKSYVFPQEKMEGMLFENV